MNFMLVSDYINKYVEPEFKAKFIRLIQEWDGSKNPLESFYSLNVLKMKQKEAME